MNLSGQSADISTDRARWGNRLFTLNRYRCAGRQGNRPMISHAAFRHATLAAVFGLGLVAASAPVQATGNFDGKWSVVIVTEKGDCDRAYRYPIDIRNANLINAGNASFDISGKVQGDGAVAVKISYGQKSAQGSGRLSGNSGEGRWAGSGCAGSWMAERRS